MLNLNCTQIRNSTRIYLHYRIRISGIIEIKRTDLITLLIPMYSSRIYTSHHHLHPSTRLAYLITIANDSSRVVINTHSPHAKTPPATQTLYKQPDDPTLGPPPVAQKRLAQWVRKQQQLFLPSPARLRPQCNRQTKVFRAGRRRWAVQRLRGPNRAPCKEKKGLFARFYRRRRCRRHNCCWKCRGRDLCRHRFVFHHCS